MILGLCGKRAWEFGYVKAGVDVVVESKEMPMMEKKRTVGYSFKVIFDNGFTGRIRFNRVFMFYPKFVTFGRAVANANDVETQSDRQTERSKIKRERKESKKQRKKERKKERNTAKENKTRRPKRPVLCTVVSRK